jgi:hypothetical protein
MKRSTMLKAVFAAGLALSALGCGASSPSEDVGTTSSDIVIVTGTSFWGLAGIGLNGTSLDGSELAPRTLVGVSLSGVQAGSCEISTYLNGSVLEEAGGQGRGCRNQSLIGAVFVGTLDDGTQLPLVIESTSADTNPAVADLQYYVVSYETTSGNQPLCGLDGSGNPVSAIALAGEWNYATGTVGAGSHVNTPDAFTFACVGYALADCALVGYEPWNSIQVCQGSGRHQRCTDVSLAPLHQACTRAYRADYCGDGVSYTVNGTPIDVYDGYGYRTATSGWTFEAEWTDNGARCATTLRVPSLGTPPCWSSLQNPSCGSTADFSEGALIMNQDQP